METFEKNPLKILDRWVEEARQLQPTPQSPSRPPTQATETADAMVLATSTRSGVPSARVVLYKGLSRDGIRFFTNYTSRKGKELAGNPRAALVFYWPPLGRQVRVEGKIKKLSQAESDAYWASRPRGSQMSAIASEQSRPISDRSILEERVEGIREAFEGEEIPRPKFWGGFALIPEQIEFWQSMPDRLHDRTLFTRVRKTWKISKLSP